MDLIDLEFAQFFYVNTAFSETTLRSSFARIDQNVHVNHSSTTHMQMKMVETLSRLPQLQKRKTISVVSVLA